MARQLEEMLADVPFLDGMGSDRLALLAGCASNVHFDAGEVIFREGEPADAFYVVRHGTVALETPRARARPVMVETIDAGEVLGWSWLFPPYRCALRRARSLERPRNVLRRRVPARRSARTTRAWATT